MKNQNGLGQLFICDRKYQNVQRKLFLFIFFISARWAEKLRWALFICSNTFNVLSFLFSVHWTEKHV